MAIRVSIKKASNGKQSKYIPKKYRLPKSKKVKNKPSKILTIWLVFVVGTALLPLCIKSVAYLLTQTNIFNENIKFSSELLFFAILLTIDNIKNITIDKVTISPEALHIFFIGLLLIFLILSVVLYGMVLKSEITNVTDDFLYTVILKYCAIILSFLSVILGFIIQLFKIFNKGGKAR